MIHRMTGFSLAAALVLAQSLALAQVLVLAPGLALAQPAVTGAEPSTSRGAINGPGLSPKADARIVGSGLKLAPDTSTRTTPVAPLNGTAGCVNGSSVGGTAPVVSTESGSNAGPDNATGTGSGSTC